MPNDLTFQFRCRFPVAVSLGRERWILRVEYWGKNCGKASLVATNSQGRSGMFASGRAETVERALGMPFTVPQGTIRHRLAAALIATGRAIVVSDEEPDVPM